MNINEEELEQEEVTTEAAEEAVEEERPNRLQRKSSRSKWKNICA